MMECLLSLSINIALPLADSGTLMRVEVVVIIFGHAFITSFHSVAAFWVRSAYVSGLAGAVGRAGLIEAG